MRMRQGLSAGLLSLVVFAGLAVADSSSRVYIKDVENLLNSVPSHDPVRMQLTLKLADAFFNEALKLSGQPMMTPQETQTLAADRRRSLLLYKDALGGVGGLVAAPQGAARAKILFQMARLQSDLGDAASAEKIWGELAKTPDVQELQRESILRLAEAAENKNTDASLKDSAELYQKAILMCPTQDVCAYAHYRLSWVRHRMGAHDDAVAEMQKALWDSKGQIREESLRDLITFLADVPGDGKAGFALVEPLAAKLNRPALIGDLADAYFAHGNRVGGVFVLTEINKKVPSLKSFVRLMEEDYGFRNWEKFEADVDGANGFIGRTEPDGDSEKILRRLTVQLDGERMTQPQTVSAFKRSVMLYLSLFPQRAERVQMIDGWLAAEADSSAKMAQLKTWIAEEKTAKRTAEETRLRKIRASLAQAAQNQEIVVEEMTALEALVPAAQKREISYQIAYAQYSVKNDAAALPRFQELAQLSANTPPDKWAIQSEHLALDILARQKNYAQVLTQVRLWTRDPRFESWLVHIPAQSTELKDMKKVEVSAEFEWAISLGQKPEALEVFKRDCFLNVLTPQSCSNAQVLAVKLADEASLIEILRKTGKKSELAAELEASAEFNKAAGILEQELNPKTSSTQDYLKVALLYELGGSDVNRNRTLKSLIGKLNGASNLGVEEDLLLQTLKDADLLEPSILSLKWKTENRDFLTDMLVEKGRDKGELRKTLSRLCRDTGPAWKSVALEELKALDQKQAKTHFAGAGSKRKFEKRVAEMKDLVTRANCYMESTTAEMRVTIATLLVRSQLSLAEEIKSAPIPEGIDEEAKASLVKGLEEFAQPFVDRAQEFERVAKEQLEKVMDGNTKRALSALLADRGAELRAPTSNGAIAAPAVAGVRTTPGQEILNQAVQELHRNPNQRSSLSQLKAFYEDSGKPRLAAYFAGRLLQLGEEKKQ